MNNNKQKKTNKNNTLKCSYFNIIIFESNTVNTLISIVKYDYYYDILDATFILFVNYRRGN